MPAVAHAGHAEGSGHERSHQTSVLGDLLRARPEGGGHVAGLSAKLGREGDFQLPRAVLGVHGQDVHADCLHVALQVVAELHGFGILQGGEDVDAVKVWHPSFVVARLHNSKLELATNKQLIALATELLELAEHLHADCSRHCLVLDRAHLAAGQLLTIDSLDRNARFASPRQDLFSGPIRHQLEVRTTCIAHLLGERQHHRVGAHGDGTRVHEHSASPMPCRDRLRQGLAVEVYDLEADVLSRRPRFHGY
mmetsp:Transcript_1146/g.2945  ORF Transcript_1146/g.2945 Transcript_1146/m.2945 type:complete len:251 (+) Transcript_1146:741-1493(+)